MALTIRTLLVGCLALTACPSSVKDPGARPTPAPKQADASDPRVAQDGADLYPKKVLERSELNRQDPGRYEPPPEPTASPGTGVPDETNGVCRLFAPKLKNPECCVAQLGFDAPALSKACNLPVYLGESHQYSCGYFFERENGAKPAWFRLSVVPGASPAEAAASHDRRMKRIAGEDFASTPVPGVEGALWSRHDGLAWAFLPGWSGVRQLAWRDEFCDQKQMARIIGQIASAPQPPEGAERKSMIPRAG